MTSRFRVEVGSWATEPDPAWSLEWLDRAAGVARLFDGSRSVIVAIEGEGTTWFVVVDGRRVEVTVRSRREQLLADAEGAGRQSGGPIDVRASLPGLVVAISAEAGSEVVEGAPLLTIEAMKMQNEVRAPRAGRVASVAVAAGQPVAAGTLLLRLE